MEASPEAQKKVAKPKKSPARRTAQVVKDAEMEAKVATILARTDVTYFHHGSIAPMVTHTKRS